MSVVEIPGAPVPKGRPRTYRDKRTGKTRTVTPQRTRDYEAHVARTYRAAGGEHLGNGPVRLELWVSNERVVVTVEPADAPTAKRPRGDLDNITKAVADALNGLAFDDDRQIVELAVRVA